MGLQASIRVSLMDKLILSFLSDLVQANQEDNKKGKKKRKKMLKNN